MVRLSLGGYCEAKGDHRENVAGFKDWGPLGRKGRPVQSKKGQTFRKFVAQMEGIGYHTEYRELIAADYGAPTMRRRFFLIARRDGRPIAWPEPTHTPTFGGNAPGQKFQLYTGAFTQIDFSNMGEPVLWEENGSRIMRPAARKTAWRFQCGIKKFIEDNPEPFLIHGTGRTGKAWMLPSSSSSRDRASGAISVSP